VEVGIYHGYCGNVADLTNTPALFGSTYNNGHQLAITGLVGLAVVDYNRQPGAGLDRTYRTQPKPNLKSRLCVLLRREQ